MSYSTALVTGGSVGIGMSICQSLLDAGLEVVNLARRPLKIQHLRLRNFTVDLSDRDETAKVAKEIQATLKVTILVHNAGVIQPSLLEDVSLEDLDYLTNLHLAVAHILDVDAFLDVFYDIFRCIRAGQHDRVPHPRLNKVLVALTPSVARGLHLIVLGGNLIVHIAGKNPFIDPNCSLSGGPFVIDIDGAQIIRHRSIIDDRHKRLCHLPADHG